MFKILSVLVVITLTGCAVYPVQPYSTAVQPSIVVPSPIIQQPVIVNPTPVYQPPVVYPRPVVVNPTPVYRPSVVYSRPCCSGGIYYQGPTVSVGIRY